jgi:lipooligosaccharide transport system permease protein
MALAPVLEHMAVGYRRTFRASIFSSFLSPVLFLTAMGLGVGSYVNQSSNGSQALGGLTYLQFLAPGLLAATAMQAASFEATFPVMGGLVWQRIFHAMYATPITPRDIVLGLVTWISIRLLMITAIFTGVIVVFGAAASPLIVLAIPAAILTGLAFATPIIAFSATQRTPDKFNYLFRFGVTPLFLFSGTFFPISNLPAILQPIAWLSPLWHGVELTRGLALGTIGQEPLLALVHVAVLVAIVAIGLDFAYRTVESRLVRG